MIYAPTESLLVRAVRLAAVGTLAFVFSATLPGCDVSHHEGAKGKDNVDVSTPFGGLHVHADKDGSTVNTGLTVYPGATPWKDSDHDENNADVGFSFGKFHLGVHAAEFKTADAEDKVVAFYRKDMAKYGDVLECHGDEAVGSVKKTSAGLSCSDHDKNNIHVHDNSDEDLQLRAGSPEHQHIVGFEKKDGMTKIGLVALDLPHKTSSSDGAEEE